MPTFTSKPLAPVPVAAKVPVERYVIIVLVTLLCIALVVLLLWGLWRLLRRKRRFRKLPGPFPIIPMNFQKPELKSKRVQPATGAPLFADLKNYARRSSVLSIPSTSNSSFPSTRSRRQSVPILPVHLSQSSCSSAMDYTLRHHSSVFSDGPKCSIGSDVSEIDDREERRESVSSKRRRSSAVDLADLNVNMYMFGPESAPNAYGLGKLCFSLAYNESTETLHVRVNRATYLSAAKRAQETGNYYVEVSLMSTVQPDEAESKRQKTNVVTSLRNPEFEQDFFFNTSPEDLNAKVLEFLIKEKRRQKEILKGSVTFALFDIQAKLDDSNLTCIWRDITKDDCTDRSAGQIYVSLCYRPKRLQLQVGIVKCRDLTINEQENGVICKVSMMSALKALKNEKSKLIRKELNSPLINEVFVFDLHQSLLTNVCLSLTVWSRKSFGQLHLLGKTIIGPMTYCDGAGYAHWNTMMQDADKIVHCWHDLKKL